MALPGVKFLFLIEIKKSTLYRRPGPFLRFRKALPHVVSKGDGKAIDKIVARVDDKERGKTAGFQRFQKGETFLLGLKREGFAVLFVNGFSHKVGERLEFELKSDFKHAIYTICLRKL